MDKFLIVGLGNPGGEYDNTRHNIGFEVLDELANQLKAKFSMKRYGEVASTKLKGRPVFLLKPTTYMNLSGKAVRFWMNEENINIKNILIVVDDIALPLGMLRMKKKGSDGGHNGLANINEILQSGQYPRLRFGIGNDFARGYQVEYVLGRWESAERKVLEEKIKKAIEMCQAFVTIGIERTMNFYNEKSTEP